MQSIKDQCKNGFLQKLKNVSGVTLGEASSFEKYMALASFVKDKLMEKWVDTNERYLKEQEKQVYYFSLEFLLGKMLDSSLIYQGIKEQCEEALAELGINLAELEEAEPDPGLGNGGLGRLAACFLDSMANLALPGHGCGIRYKYGLFQQKIIDGYQVELPDNWLKEQSVWEVRKSNKAVVVKFGGTVRMEEREGRIQFLHEDYEPVLAVPYDVPVPSLNKSTVNTLRLWKAEAADCEFDFGSFSRGDYGKAVEHNYTVEAISEVLYPDDSNYANRVLRLKQQYFFVSAGLQSILRRYKKKNGSLKGFADKIAIHINDTHPAIAVPELMRLLLDEEGLGWDEAWDITVHAISYTNHTIMPEALEKWPVDIFKPLLPRIWMIVEEINERFCKSLWDTYPGDWDRIRNMAVIADGQVRMANLAIVGSYSVNGVAAVHTNILKKELFRDFHDYQPDKFNNKTNGITHRRWLLKANPGLAGLISESIGTDWVDHPLLLENLTERSYDKDPSFLESLQSIKHQNKIRLSNYIKEKIGLSVDPESMFDVHVKRIHAYKRQLLKVFHILNLYNSLLLDPSLDIPNRTFIFSGKAAPSYYYAKSVIKLINTVADLINRDSRINGRIKVVFLENYGVSLAELLFPAADLSEQISTASKEASGTSNMKFMMNGALTIGTLDGANIEILEAAGAENMFIFGLNVEEVLGYYRNGDYNAWDLYNYDYRLRSIIESLINESLPARKAEFAAIYSSLLEHNDEFFVLKDFASYIEAQAHADLVYRDRNKWLQKSVVNISKSGRFSSDETISRYAAEIWGIKPSIIIPQTGHHLFQEVAATTEDLS